MKFIYLLAGTIFMTSCAIHFGNTESNFIPENIVYEDLSIGVAQSQRVLHLGGVAKDALVLEAKMNMLQNRPLRQGEQYINTTVDIKQAYFILFAKTKVTVSADIIRKSTSADSVIYSPTYLAKIRRPSFQNYFVPGDSVTDTYVNGIVESVKNEKKVRVIYKNDSGNIRSGHTACKDLYKLSFNYNGIQPGDTVYYVDDESGSLRFSIAKGINEKHLLLNQKIITLKEIIYKDSIK